MTDNAAFICLVGEVLYLQALGVLWGEVSQGQDTKLKRELAWEPGNATWVWAARGGAADGF